MENNTKGAGDDYPIIPQPDTKIDEFRLQNYRAMENKLLSANSDVKRLKEELATLKEVVKELIPLAMDGLSYMSQSNYDKYSPVIDRAKRISDNK